MILLLEILNVEMNTLRAHCSKEVIATWKTICLANWLISGLSEWEQSADSC